MPPFQYERVPMLFTPVLMKGWCLNSGLLDDKGTLRGEVINDTANNTSQKPARQKSIQIQVSWPCCNSMYFEKAAKELTLSL